MAAGTGPSHIAFLEGSMSGLAHIATALLAYSAVRKGAEMVFDNKPRLQAQPRTPGGPQ